MHNANTCMSTDAKKVTRRVQTLLLSTDDKKQKRHASVQAEQLTPTPPQLDQAGLSCLKLSACHRYTSTMYLCDPHKALR